MSSGPPLLFLFDQNIEYMKDSSGECVNAAASSANMRISGNGKDASILGL
jgi:hypothetical protein